MLSNKLKLCLVVLPLVCILMMMFLDLPIKNTDALTYHLYYSRVISEQGLNFFSDRPIPLANELGFGLSAYYPWLFSHLISTCHNLLRITYDNSVYVLTSFLYLVLVFSFKENKSRLILATYLLIPIIFEYFFVAGTNYFLTSFLVYFTYKSIWNNQRFLRILYFIVSSYLLINCHVLGIYFVCILSVYGLCYTKDRLYILLFIGALVYQLTHNFLLTGSISFPFLQETFPHKNFNFDEWKLINDQIKNGIFWEAKSWLYTNIFFILYGCISILYVLTRKFLSKAEKALLIMLLIPSLLVFLLAFRHRIIFVSCFLFLFVDIFEKKQRDYKIELKEIYQFIKPKIIYFIYLLLFVFLLKTIVSQHLSQSTSRISIISVKKCFYDNVSELSLDNKIMLTETELYKIANPKNIEPVDGKNFTEMSLLNSSDDFLNYLRRKKIKYLTHTPLSTQETKFSERNAYHKYMNDLLHKGHLVVYRDCVASNHINNSFLPYYEDVLLKNWLIYEVN